MTNKLEYKGFVLQVKQLAKEGDIVYYESTCPEFSSTYVFKGTNVGNLFKKFQKEVDMKINEEVIQVEDPDLAIVGQFFSELKRVSQEMTALGQVDYLVLAVKLSKVYEFYKDYIPLTHEVMGCYYQKINN